MDQRKGRKTNWEYVKEMLTNLHEICIFKSFELLISKPHLPQLYIAVFFHPVQCPWLYQIKIHLLYILVLCTITLLTLQPAMYFCILGYFYPMGGAVIISVLYVCTQFFWSMTSTNEMNTKCHYWHLFSFILVPKE